MSPKRQAIIGLLLSGLIAGSWLAINVATVFSLDIAAQPIWLLALLVVVQCWLSVGLFIIAHDAMHGTLVPFRPRINALLGQVALALYAGFRFAPLNHAHHAHHRHAGTAADPDFNDRPPHAFWPWYVAFMRHYFGWREALTISALVGVYVVAFGAAPANVVLFWAVPAIASSLQLFTFGTWLPHKPDPATPFVDRHRTRTNAFPAWLSLLTCFHFGYHHEHHEQPSLPWWRLPAARRAASRDMR